MAVFTIAAGQTFDVARFSGLLAPVALLGPGATSVGLQTGIWVDVDGNGSFDGSDYLIGRVDYDLSVPLLPIPPGETSWGFDPNTGITNATFVDMVSGQVIGTLTDAPYSFQIGVGVVGSTIQVSITENYLTSPVGNFMGDDTVTLGAGDDTFFDPDGHLFIRMGNGNDTLFAAGDLGDTIFGDGGRDRITTQGTDNLIYAGGGNDTVLNAGWNGVASHGETIVGGSGHDSLEGSGDGDTFVEGAGSGNDVLSGLDGIDTVNYAGAGAAVTVLLAAFAAMGGSGDDVLNSIERIVGSDFGDTVVGMNASEYFDGRAGDDLLTGGNGNDTLLGQAGGDNLQGGSNIDKLDGGAGADYVNGGAQRDVLTGGDGDDVFAFWASWDSLTTERDIITDFSQVAGNRDVIDLSVANADETDLSMDHAFFFTRNGGQGGFRGHAGELRWVVSGSTTTVLMDVNGDRVTDMAIALKGAFTLTAEDFHF